MVVSTLYLSNNVNFLGTVGLMPTVPKNIYLSELINSVRIILKGYAKGENNGREE